MSCFTIEITSPPDREFLVAEIWFNELHVAEVSVENGEFAIEIYKPHKLNYWTFSLNEFLETIEETKYRLTSIK